MLRCIQTIQYASWLDTSIFATMPHPLTYDTYDGNFGHEFITLSDTRESVPVLYGVCPVDSFYKLSNSGLRYTVIDDLFLPEHSPALPHYSTYMNSIDDIPLKLAGWYTICERDFAKALTNMAFRLAGYETTTHVAVETEDCKVKRFLWWVWSDCDTYRRPKGQIAISTPNGTTGVSGIKVRLFRWFRTDDVYTDGSGTYQDLKRWEVLVCTDDISYSVICAGNRQGVSATNQWNLKVGIIAGAVPLWTYTHTFGFKSSKGYSTTINVSASKLWGRCVLNNAMYDYCLYAESEHLTPPPYHLDIATSDKDDGMASAPLLKNHLNVSLMKIADIDLVLAVMDLLTTPIVYALLPDLILRYPVDYNQYNNKYCVLWHELSHASQFNRVVYNSNIAQASLYWSDVVAYEVYHSVKSGFKSPYGSVGDTGWQQIALVEGWAYFREWYMGRRYLNYDNKASFYFGKTMVQYQYSLYFLELYNAGISMSYMESALSLAYSLSDFKDNLLDVCPANLSGIIKTILP